MVCGGAVDDLLGGKAAGEEEKNSTKITVIGNMIRILGAELFLLIIKEKLVVFEQGHYYNIRKQAARAKVTPIVADDVE